MHISFSILESQFSIHESSVPDVESLLGQELPARTPPVVLQKQLKLVLYVSQEKRIIEVLRGFGSQMWSSSLPKNRGDQWISLFCLMSLLAMAADKIIVAARTQRDARIIFQESYVLQKEEEVSVRNLEQLIRREFFDRCTEIFHWKFKTRKGGKEACNPIRDGFETLQGKGVDSQLESGAMEFVKELQNLAASMGTHLPSKVVFGGCRMLTNYCRTTTADRKYGQL